jgi:hypothetical protein
MVSRARSPALQATLSGQVSVSASMSLATVTVTVHCPAASVGNTIQWASEGAQPRHAGTPRAHWHAESR